LQADECDCIERARTRQSESGWYHLVMPGSTPSEWRLVNATLVLPDRLMPGGALHVRDGRIAAIGRQSELPRFGGPAVDARGQYAAPGFIDMHVHGGGGGDFMDGTPEAFATAIAAHARHGTTTIISTSTVARHGQTLRFLDLCRTFRQRGPDAERGLCRVGGAHLYGPYFAEDKVGCHPKESARPPTPDEYEQYLAFAADGTLVTATCAPELPGAADFYRAARRHGVRLNAGHSNATWDEMAMAYELGVRHVDHFFCAMSNYVSVRTRTGTPMRGGMMEYVLASPDMTTEVIADGRHLAPELLRFILKMLGPSRIALVTDCMRALDKPPGEYMFGPLDGGAPIISDGLVGLMPDGVSLASSIRGMDFMVRHMHKTVGIDLPTTLRMASLTPAKIVGMEREIGSLEVGKRADVLVLDDELTVRSMWVDGLPVVFR
jgi:N-acetylglucosamine-6-phosphate deacetylase